MTDKDPKDMTASELLRWLADIDDQSNCQMCVSFYTSDECGGHRCSDWKRDLADKIDAELVKARRMCLDHVAHLWAEDNGWPDFRDGEDFGAWLERCFLPRPRFDDGEPVHIGDKAYHPYTGETCTIDCINTFDDSYCLGFIEERSAALLDGERVKRPAPEVLGADGLPIKVGDAMWSLSGAGPLTVTSLHTDDPTPDGGDSPWADLDDDGLYSWIYAGSLTHTPPDTQERIDEDKKKENSKYWGCCFYCNNCPDEIDGKKPRERYGSLNCSIAQGMDIARRQYELDKRKGGDA